MPTAPKTMFAQPVLKNLLIKINRKTPVIEPGLIANFYEKAHWPSRLFVASLNDLMATGTL